MVFFNDTATTEIYTLSLHDALPISSATATRTHSSTTGTPSPSSTARRSGSECRRDPSAARTVASRPRSEEHTSELQSRQYLVCRLLLEKKNILFLLLCLLSPFLHHY